MVQGGVDGVEMTHFLHPHDQEGNVEDANGDEEVADSVQEARDRFATTIKGFRDSTHYVIDHYSYIKHRIRGKTLNTRCRYFRYNQCRAKAFLEPDTLRVIKLNGVHTCRQRIIKISKPSLKSIQGVETEMKKQAQSL